MNHMSNAMDWKVIVLDILSSIWSIIRTIVEGILSLFVSSSSGGLLLTFDNGVKVRVGKQIAEGGFSFVHEAFDSRTGQKYALKKIHCADSELVRACRAEANVHRLIQPQKHCLPLLGLKFDITPRSGTVCYMLFPFIGTSLRQVLTEKQLLRDDIADTDRRPFSELELLHLTKNIISGLQAMHDAGFAHYDVKVENILLQKCKSGKGIWEPVLMDFGSVKPIKIQLKDRRTVLNIVEEASTNTTVTYRPPELFEGGCRHGPSSQLDGSLVDVWSLGCVIFAIMYGTSPFEVEFRTDGSVRVVECTHLRVLGAIPFPPPHTETGQRYSHALQDLIQWILTVDRTQRPTLDQVSHRVDDLLQQLEGTYSDDNNNTKPPSSSRPTTQPDMLFV